MQEQLAAAGLVYPETFDSAHNGYVTILVENGLPALVMYAAFLGTMLLLGVRAGQAPPLAVGDNPGHWMLCHPGLLQLQHLPGGRPCSGRSGACTRLNWPRSVSRRICRKKTKEETVC